MHKPIAFIFTRPTATAKELAVYRESLRNFIEGHVPPDSYPDCAVTLNVGHLLRFMEDARRLERANRELRQGLHEGQQALVEQLVEGKMLAEALVEGLPGSFLSEPLGHSIAALADWAATAGMLPGAGDVPE